MISKNTQAALTELRNYVEKNYDEIIHRIYHKDR